MICLKCDPVFILTRRQSFLEIGCDLIWVFIGKLVPSQFESPSLRLGVTNFKLFVFHRFHDDRCRCRRIGRILSENHGAGRDLKICSNDSLHHQLQGRICRVVRLDQNGLLNLAVAARKGEFGGKLRAFAGWDYRLGELGSRATTSRAHGSDDEVGAARIFQDKCMINNFRGVFAHKIKGRLLAKDARLFLCFDICM